MPRKNESNFVVTFFAIGVSAVAGHLVGRAIRPIVRHTVPMEPASEAAKEQMAEEEGFTVGITPRELLPGIAVALLMRPIVGRNAPILGGTAFLGSLVLTVISGTEYDKQARSVLRRFAPGGSFLA